MIFQDLYVTLYYVQNKCASFRAGCVSHFMDNWHKITSDREILTTAKREGGGGAIELI